MKRKIPTPGMPCGFDPDFDPEYEKYRRSRWIQEEQKASEIGPNKPKEVQKGSNRTLERSS